MSQVGVIVVSDNINLEAWINKAKEDNPKFKISNNVETTDKGVKYISINKE